MHLNVCTAYLGKPAHLHCKTHISTKCSTTYRGYPAKRAYAWQVGPFWQDTLDMSTGCNSSPYTPAYASQREDKFWRT